MKCPICQRETHADFRPFCSRRCADVDLGRWLTGAYRVPVEDDAAGPAPDSDDGGADPAAPRRPH